MTSAGGPVEAGRRLVKRFVQKRSEGRVATGLAAAKGYEDEVWRDAVVRAISRMVEVRDLTEAGRHNLLYRIQRELLPEFTISDVGRLAPKDGEFREYFARFSGDNWLSYDRKWNVHQLLQLTAGVDGDFAEAGCYEGGTAFLLCQVARDDGRPVHLFDSFEGLSSPGSGDGDHWSAGDLQTSRTVLEENLARFTDVRVYEGWIPDRFPEISERRFAFVHVDVDLEQPTRDSLEFFYPRMSAGGIIVLDDHGFETCPGARVAALEFCADKREPLVELASGQGLIVRSA